MWTPVWFARARTRTDTGTRAVVRVPRCFDAVEPVAPPGAGHRRSSAGPITTPGTILKRAAGVLAAGVLAVALLLAATPAAHAQIECTSVNPPCPNELPHIDITPSGGTVSGADLAVTVSVNDDHAINAASFSVTLTGATGSAFVLGLDPNGASGRAMQTIHLQTGSGNQVSAHVCDSDGLCDTTNVTYTYSPPPRRQHRGRHSSRSRRTTTTSGMPRAAPTAGQA